MALTISQLVNDYGSYSGNTLVGELGSRATVPGSGFSGVRGVPYDNITFIVKVNGTRYASSKWLSEQQNGNPYIHRTSVARVDTRDIGLMSIDDTPFANREDELYAQVEATSKLGQSDDEILKFINYLLDGKDGTEPAIPNFGSFGVKSASTDPKGETFIESEAGGEPLKTGTIPVFKSGERDSKSWVGSYSVEADLGGGYPGLGFKPTGFDGFLSGDAARSQTIPPVPSEDVTEVVDLGEDFKIDLSDFTFDIPEIDFSDIDFGIGDINTNFGFGLGGDVSIGTNTNPFTNNNFSTQLSNSYSGYETDANDFNEPEIFGGFGF